MSDRHPLLPPTRLIVLDVVGALLAGLGLAGVLSDQLSWLFADPAAAWVAFAVGLAMMAYAVPGIIRWAARNARRQ